MTVCDGVSYNSLTDANGVALTKDEVRTLAEHMKFKCEHPNAGPSGMYKPGKDGQPGQVSNGKGTVTPFGTSTPYGYLKAVLNISPGYVSYWTQASSMPAYVDKTLTCEVMWNNGAWQYCGQVTGYSTTYLSTSTYSSCPYPGQSVEVEAWLDIYGAQYWDSADGITQ